MTERSYSREEMEEILRRAAERTVFRAGAPAAVRYDDLAAAAREVGIDPSSLEEVAREVESGRAELARRADEEATVAREIGERRHRWRRRALTYAVVVTFLALLDTMTPGGPWWHFVALIWGLFVALGLARAALPPSARERERILEKEAKRRKRLERAARRARAAEALRTRLEAQYAAIQQELEARRTRADRRARAERELEQAIEDGVTALLTVLARNLERAATRASSPEEPSGEFAEFVRRKKRDGAAVASRSPDVRVRVEPASDGGVEEPESRAAGSHSSDVNSDFASTSKRARSPRP